MIQLVRLPLVLVAFLCPPAARGQERSERVATRSVAEIGRPIVARSDARGTVHLLCDAEGSPNYARSADDGGSFSKAIPVTPPEARPRGLEYSAWDLAVGKGGRVHVALGTNAWKLKLPQEEWGYFYAHLDPGAEAFSPVRNINRKPSEGFSLAADDAGRVTACWLSDRLYANISRDNGATFAPSVELDPGYDPCNCCTTSAVYRDDGRLAVLYREETRNERDMHVVLWDQSRGEASRSRLGRTRWKIEACPMSYYALSWDGRGFTAVWPTKGDVYFARLDRDARPVGPDEIKAPGKVGMRTGLLALRAPDETTLIAWKQDGRLGWQLYDRAGNPSGEPGAAESQGQGVAGIVTRDGRFLLFR